jgi:hypothetical protein
MTTQIASPFIQRIRARDRAAAYITGAVSLPICIFAVACLAAMFGSPLPFEVFYSLTVFCLYSFLSLAALMVGFHIYCWLAFRHDLRSY